MDSLIYFIQTLAPFLVVIVVVVVFHEFGHYLAARLSGLEVSEFSVGFGTPIWKRRDRNGTEWRFAPILLGGYVKIPGLGTMFNVNRNSQAGENYQIQFDKELADIPVSKKLFAVAGGPIASFVLAIIVFALVSTFQGFIKEPLVVKKIHHLPTGHYELQPGDEIQAINDTSISTLYDLYSFGNQSDPEAVFYYRVKRFSEEFEVIGPYPTPPIIDNINLESPAQASGLMVGDVILSVDGRPVGSGSDLAREVSASEGRQMDFVIFRDNQEISFSLAGEFQDLPVGNGEFEKRVLIGVGLGLAIEPDTYTPGPLDALWYGTLRTLAVVVSTLEALPKIITNEISSCNIQGPIGIAKFSGSAANQGPIVFILFIGVLSAAIGIANLLPIPVLDGGHLVFYFYELITGREANSKFRYYTYIIGLGLILSLFAFTIYNDLTC